MTKEGLGTKRTCQSCHVRFYDMEHTSVVCPKCGAEFIEDNVDNSIEAVDGPTLSTDGSSSTSTDGSSSTNHNLMVDGVDLDVDFIEFTEVAAVSLSESSDDLIEDISELENDEDDMSEVMEHVERPDII